MSDLLIFIALNETTSDVWKLLMLIDYQMTKVPNKFITVKLNLEKFNLILTTFGKRLNYWSML